MESVFSENKVTELENYLNMGLCNYDTIDKNGGNRIARLGYKELENIKALIANSYPEAWLNEELVKLNENFGL